MRGQAQAKGISCMNAGGAPKDYGLLIVVAYEYL
jgi:hypothetical protein